MSQKWSDRLTFAVKEYFPVMSARCVEERRVFEASFALLELSAVLQIAENSPELRAVANWREAGRQDAVSAHTEMAGVGGRDPGGGVKVIWDGVESTDAPAVLSGARLRNCRTESGCASVSPPGPFMIGENTARSLSRRDKLTGSPPLN